jgi:hypothetical protein
MALESLNQAYIGLEKEESKEQVKQIRDDVQRIIVGENPSIKEIERQETEILKELVEEMRALRKEVTPKTYAEKLKKGLSSSTYAPPSSSSSSFSSSSSLPLTSLLPPTSKETTSSTASTTSPTSTRGKKKQL